jgi:hypothetical protein
LHGRRAYSLDDLDVVLSLEARRPRIIAADFGRTTSDDPVERSALLGIILVAIIQHLNLQLGPLGKESPAVSHFVAFIGPPLHHTDTLFPKVGAGISAAHPVAIGMG